MTLNRVMTTDALCCSWAYVQYFRNYSMGKYGSNK